MEVEKHEHNFTPSKMKMPHCPVVCTDIKGAVHRLFQAPYAINGGGYNIDCRAHIGVNNVTLAS